MAVDFCSIGFVARVFSLGLFFNRPLSTSWKIIRKRSTEEVSIVPYARVMCLFSCLLSTWYGFMYDGNDFPNKVTDDWDHVNTIGAFALLFYVVTFIVFAPRKDKAKILGLLSFLLAVFGLLVLVSVYTFDKNSRRIFCGVAAAISNILMYSSPLFLMATTVKNISVEIMPAELSWDMFQCGTIWFIYGLRGRDPFVAVPNGFGCILGAAQLVWYVYAYCNK